MKEMEETKTVRKAEVEVDVGEPEERRVVAEVAAVAVGGATERFTRLQACHIHHWPQTQQTQNENS